MSMAFASRNAVELQIKSLVYKMAQEVVKREGSESSCVPGNEILRV